MYLNNEIKRQQGFSMPIAVFVLVIMALLAAAIVELSSRSNISATQEEISNRAFYAAESGASWAMSKLFFNPSGPANRAYSDGECTPIGGPPSLLSAPGLRDCSVIVTCSSMPSSSGLESIYTITSEGACAVGTPVEAVRTVQIGAKNG